MKGLTFGADVEFFLSADGAVTHASGRFGGTKHNPIQHPDYPKGFLYQEDGAALELNVPVAGSAAEFKDNILKMREMGITLVDSCMGRGYGLATNTHWWVQEGEGPEDVTRETHPNVFVIGCDPDYDAYLMDQRPIMNVGDLHGVRFAGGHIHVGYDVSLCPRELFVRGMDMYLRPLIEKDFQSGSQRFYYYGYPGIFRPKDYGVEYRVLSSKWTRGKYLDDTIACLTQMEDDWTNNRQAFYQKAMEAPTIGQQIKDITGEWWLPRGHTAHTAGFPPEAIDMAG